MPITPNTRPETTVRKDGVVTTVHRKNGDVSGRAGLPNKSRVLPPVAHKDDLHLIQQLAEGNAGVVVYEDSDTPAGFEVAYAKVLGVYTNFLLRDNNGQKEIVGRVEESSGSLNGYVGDKIKGGSYIMSSSKKSMGELLAFIAESSKGNSSPEELRIQNAIAAAGAYHAPKGRTPAKTKHRPNPKDIKDWSFDYENSNRYVTMESGGIDYAGIRNFEVIRVTPKDGDTQYFFGEMGYHQARNFADDETFRLQRAGT